MKKILFLSLLMSAQLSYANTKVSAQISFIANESYMVAGLTPAQINRAYGTQNLYFHGEGQTIAIVMPYDNPNAETDLATFNSNLNLPDCTTDNGCFKKILAPGAGTPNVNWGVASSISVEWAHAIAPGAYVMLVEAKDNSFASLFAAVQVAIQQGATVVAMPWGSGEFASETTYDSNFTNLNVVFVAPAGSAGNGTTYPAVAPNVIAVGGTTLTTDIDGNYLAEVAWSASGGGLSLYEAQPSYQANFPIPNNPNAKRGTPDVAYAADRGTGFAAYATYGASGWIVVGGTGVGAVQWAGIFATIKSGSHKPIVNMPALLYTAAKNRYTTVFNQITSGTNGNCGFYCTAQAGYNYVTGLGTPQVQYLAYEVIYS